MNDGLLGKIAQLFGEDRSGTVSPDGRIVGVDDLPVYASIGGSPIRHSFYDGEKFAGGFGATQLFTADYWTLRQRSVQLFTENLYARGIIRRLVTNEINVGLMPEATPDSDLLGISEDDLNDWTERIETRFGLWGKNPQVADWLGRQTWGGLQRVARLEALIGGDVLVVLRFSQRTGLPAVQLIDGQAVQSPLVSEQDSLRRGHEITEGVELDARGRVAAHWVVQKDGRHRRLPAFGEKSGRRLSWLVYGTDKRHNDVRGQPMLSLIAQSLKEIDRYRDSVQRKAVINSILAMFIQKDEDKPGTLPMQGNATRRDEVDVTDNDGAKRKFNIAEQIPGLVLEELQTGEKPVGFDSQGVDLSFGPFEDAITQSMAWANEMPPEILRLAFSNNYSASQAAINEFKIYLNKFWMEWGEGFCTPVYQEWLLAEALRQRIDAPGLLEAWRNPEQYDTFGAWTSVEWYGSIKPSTDMLKQVKGSELLVKGGYSTRAREARVTTGTKFSQNAKRLRQENELLAQAARPILELEQEFGPDPARQTVTALEDAALTLIEGGREDAG